MKLCTKIDCECEWACGDVRDATYAAACDAQRLRSDLDALRARVISAGLCPTCMSGTRRLPITGDFESFACPKCCKDLVATFESLCRRVVGVTTQEQSRLESIIELARTPVGSEILKMVLFSRDGARRDIDGVFEAP